MKAVFIDNEDGVLNTTSDASMKCLDGAVPEPSLWLGVPPLGLKEPGWANRPRACVVLSAELYGIR